MAWGLWAVQSGLTGGLSRTDTDRMGRAGFAALAADQGLALLDAALADLARPGSTAAPVATRLNPAALRAQAASGLLPALLSALVSVPERSTADGGGGGSAAGEGPAGLVSQLAGLTGAARDEALLAAVRAQIAAVLGHASPGLVEADQSFKDLGFDSLTAVDLRNRLNAASGLRLPATLVFDHPTPAALASYLGGQLQPEPQAAGGGARELLADLDRLAAALTAADLADLAESARTEAADRLGTLLRVLRRDARPAGPDQTSAAADAEALRTGPLEDVFAFIDNELGV